MSNLYKDYFTQAKVQLNDIQNTLIEGDNLLVLQDLLPFYQNKIKLIYIDPPYNTKRKFIYKDNYGSHHDWVNMMRPRLILAYQFLKDDGFIFVSIDDNEIHYLRILMDEIFGEENFRNCIIVARGNKNIQAQFKFTKNLAVGHEYILFYSKNKQTKLKKLQIQSKNAKSNLGCWNNHWRGTNRPNLRYELLGIKPQNGQWRWTKERSLNAIENYQKLLKEMQLTEEQNIPIDLLDNWFKKNISADCKYDLLRLSKTGKPEHFIPARELLLGSDLWSDLNLSGTKDLKRLLGNIGFDMPKSVDLLKRIISLITNANTNDIILDFFAGSGTTGQAVLEKNKEDAGNRSFLLIQNTESIPKVKSTKYQINNIAQLAYLRVKKYIESENLNLKINYLVQVKPNEINSSSVATVLEEVLLPSSNPSIMKDI